MIDDHVTRSQAREGTQSVPNPSHLAVAVTSNIPSGNEADQVSEKRIIKRLFKKTCIQRNTLTLKIEAVCFSKKASMKT